jgi:hypothetical protein
VGDRETVVIEDFGDFVFTVDRDPANGSRVLEQNSCPDGRDAVRSVGNRHDCRAVGRGEGIGERNVGYAERGNVGDGSAADQIERGCGAEDDAGE